MTIIDIITYYDKNCHTRNQNNFLPLRLKEIVLLIFFVETESEMKIHI
jgi:hypothetical protein